MEETLTSLAQRSVSQPRTPLAASLGEVSPLGRIEIPRLGMSAMIAEGVTFHVLSIAVGHIPDTPLPGQNGNVVLAAHRDTFFRPLRYVKPGDVIRLTTVGGQYWYVVRFTDIVGPDETWPLDPSNDQTLTLVTCYPFYYVGAAPRRFIVRARKFASPVDIQSSARKGRVQSE